MQAIEYLYLFVLLICRKKTSNPSRIIATDRPIAHAIEGRKKLQLSLEYAYASISITAIENTGILFLFSNIKIFSLSYFILIWIPLNSSMN